MNIKERKKKDVYDVARTVRNTLLDFTKHRFVFPGLLNPAPVYTPQNKKTNQIVLKSNLLDKKRMMKKSKTQNKPQKKIFKFPKDDDSSSSTTSVESLVSPLKRQRKDFIAITGVQSEPDYDSDDHPLYVPEKNIRLKQYTSQNPQPMDADAETSQKGKQPK